MGSGCFTRSHQKSFPCCAPICSDNLHWFTSEGMNNALARKTRLARTRSSPYGLCWLHVLYCFILFYRVLRFHGDVTCFIMWDIMVHRVIDRNMARIQRMFPAAYKFVPPTWVGLWDNAETSETSETAELTQSTKLPRSSPMISLTWRRDLVTTRSQRPVILFGTWNVVHCSALLVSAPSAPLVSALKNMHVWLS